MKEITFSVPGLPQGKQRPRIVPGHAYTPSETKTYEQAVQWAYKVAHGVLFDGPVDVVVIANFTPKTKDELKHATELRHTAYTKKPDADNILKIVLDAFNGLAYNDDAAVAYASVRKQYGDTDCVEIHISN